MMQKKNSKPDRPSFFFILMLVILVSFSVGFAQDSSPTPSQRILIVFGPHYGIPTGEILLPAIVNTLRSGGIPGENIHVEFLDLFRFPDLAGSREITALLTHKYASTPIDLIVPISQEAVDYVARDLNHLFPGALMLIPGFEAEPAWTGLPRPLIALPTELDIKGTLQLALELFPAADRLLVITGDDRYSRLFLEQISAVAEQFSRFREVRHTADLTYLQMIELLEDLPRDTVAIFGTYFADATGKSFTPATVAAAAAARSSVPVFGIRDVHVENGLFGGSVIMNSKLGEQTAKTALDYLSGKLMLAGRDIRLKAEHFPLVDWLQLKRFNISTDSLPVNAVFLNRPLSIWDQYKETVITSMVSIVLLIVLTIALVFQILKQKKLIIKLNNIEIALRKNEALLSRSQELGQIGSWSLDVNTNTLKWSDEVFRIFGCEPQGFTPTYEAFLDFIHPDDSAAMDETYTRSVKEKSKGYEIEHRILRQGSAEIRYVFERCVHVCDATGAIVQSIGMVQDITEHKRAIKKMAAQLHELQRWHDVMIDREGRLIELKREVNELLAQIGQPPRYPGAVAGENPP